MAKSLLDNFRELDQPIKETLADISSPLLLSFAALDLAYKKCGIERLTVEHITACLEVAGVAVKKTSISRSLARAKNRVSTGRNEDGKVSYKLMTKGKREIEPLLGGEKLSVVRVESNRPRTAFLTLRKILSTITGVVRICDPYYGVRTLDTLDHFPKTCEVRFLTAKSSETRRKIQGALRDFKKERPKVEFRIAANPQDLHDRYIIAKDQLLILGHGLKDIGGKESFIIRLDHHLVPDLIKEMIAIFDIRWAQGITI